MEENNENDDFTPTAVGDAVALFKKRLTRVGERGKCNWVPIEEGSTTMKCTYCGDYDFGDTDDENYY